MRRAPLAVFCYAIFTLGLPGCDLSTEPLHRDIDLAHRAWVELNAQDYTFEMSIESSMLPKSGFFRIRVENKIAVEVLDEGGAPHPQFTFTVDKIWDEILVARTFGEVNSVLFDVHGVPIETDLGPWPVDGGRRYLVRRFSRQR